MNTTHTPEEASKLWCPLVRVSRRETIQPGKFTDSTLAVVGGCNSDALNSNRVPMSCRCVSERCAMWRWEPMTETVRAEPDSPTWKQVPVQTRGYCGLAAQPVSVML